MNDNNSQSACNSRLGARVVANARARNTLGYADDNNRHTAICIATTDVTIANKLPYGSNAAASNTYQMAGPIHKQ